MEYESTGTKFDYKYLGLEIPLYAIGQVKAGNGKIFFGAGQYVGVGLNAKYQPGNINLYKKDETSDISSLRRWDFGVALMAGYEFNKLLTINVGYKHGYLNLLKTGNDEVAMRNETVNIGVGIRF